VIGRRISYIDISEEDARKGMKQTGMTDWLIDVIMDGFNYIIKGDYGSSTTTLVKQITGQEPISFSQFAKDHVDAFR
jgi:ABC-type molybdenum transport system ATPase subunit/photorepair protein PhrA